MTISICNPPGFTADHFHRISDITWHDLGFDQIILNLSRDEQERSIIRRIMMDMTDDPAVAAYRCDVFADLLANPELRRKIQKLLERISQLEDHMSLRHNIDRSDSIWTLMRRLKEIDEYIECVETLGDCLADYVDLPEPEYDGQDRAYDRLSANDGQDRAYDRLPANDGQNRAYGRLLVNDENAGAADKTSEALRLLAVYIRKIRTETGFDELKKDIRGLRVLTSKVKSITLGVNLDDNYDVSEVGIISLNDKEFTKSGLLSHFAGHLAAKDKVQAGSEWKNSYTYEPIRAEGGMDEASVSRAGVAFAMVKSPLMALGVGMTAAKGNETIRSSVSAMDRVMAEMIPASVHELKEVLAKYVTVDIHSITDLIPEFIYYIRWAEYIEKLQEEGFTFSRAQVIRRKTRELYVAAEAGNDGYTAAAAGNDGYTAAEAGTKGPELSDSGNGKTGENSYVAGQLTMRARGIYNMKLAVGGHCTPAEIVTNDLDFCPERNLYILTGANRGGKTTITQAIGQLFLMAQGGIYIPGQSFAFEPADAAYTHFPADEDKTMDFGRLGEECSRFREIYSAATETSLILLNESFSTTSFEEGYYIACDAVRALLLKGSRTIYNTHMHKLARELDTLNQVCAGIGSLDENVSENRPLDGNSSENHPLGGNSSENHPLGGKIPCRAASLIVKNEGSRRSYKVEVAPPEGTSYARDIAEKYGVTFELLTKE